MMKLSEFKYNIPKNAIARFPAEPRDSSKLLVINRETGDMHDKIFSDIATIMQKGDCLVMNDTKVFPARLFGKKRENKCSN